jgi:3-hydroxybutyryl-CoA dehydrogenase
MSFNVPTDFASRPVAVIGAGTLGRRIAVMFAAHGAQVRIHDLAEAQRNAAVEYVSQNLPGLADRLTDVVLAGFRPMPTLPRPCTTRGWSSRPSPSGSN